MFRVSKQELGAIPREQAYAYLRGNGIYSKRLQSCQLIGIDSLQSASGQMLLRASLSHFGIRRYEALLTQPLQFG